MYTFNERFVKNRTVWQAISQAENMLKEKRLQLCTNTVYRKNLQKTDKITLKEQNELAEELYQDSLYYAVPWKKEIEK